MTEFPYNYSVNRLTGFSPFMIVNMQASLIPLDLATIPAKLLPPNSLRIQTIYDDVRSFIIRLGDNTYKAGGIDVLHCYYAHGEENGSFRRRSYWMLDEAYKHIVLVHYLKVKVHVRGYKMRKNYRNIFMSVGIVEVILRWRRKGSGFRRFRHGAVIEGFATQNEPSKVDDYDVLRKGQTKERWQRALVRVNSMVQYPEAIDQYCRLLTIAPEFQETKVMNDRVLNRSEDTGAYGEDDLMSMLLSTYAN